MNEKKVTITEQNGSYQVQNEGISDFALIGILECILYDMKSAGRRELETEQRESLTEQNTVNRELPEVVPSLEPAKRKETAQSEPESAAARENAATQETVALDVRTRIGNAIKAVRKLGGKVEENDLNNLTDEELQLELEELTAQYKRLKSSKASK